MYLNLQVVKQKYYNNFLIFFTVMYFRSEMPMTLIFTIQTNFNTVLRKWKSYNDTELMCRELLCESQNNNSIIWQKNPFTIANNKNLSISCSHTQYALIHLLLLFIITMSALNVSLYVASRYCYCFRLITTFESQTLVWAWS